MQSLNDYEPVAGPDGFFCGVPGALDDHFFLDLPYFPGYLPMVSSENLWELGNAGLEQQQRQLSHPGTCIEGLGQEPMINTVAYDKLPLDTLSSTTWGKPRDQEQLTPLETPSTLSGSPKTITPTKHTSPMSPFSSPPSPMMAVSPKDENTRLQNKRYKNRLAAAKCRKGAKGSTDRLQLLERNLRQTNEMLQIEAKDLRDEVYNLKTAILRHSHCDSDSIQRYIQRAAERVGQEMR